MFKKNCDILGSYRSDHSAVVLHGLWKFNNSLLKELEYIEIIGQVIGTIKKQYAGPIYVEYYIDVYQILKFSLHALSMINCF